MKSKLPTLVRDHQQQAISAYVELHYTWEATMDLKLFTTLLIGKTKRLENFGFKPFKVSN